MIELLSLWVPPATAAIAYALYRIERMSRAPRVPLRWHVHYEHRSLPGSDVGQAVAVRVLQAWTDRGWMDVPEVYHD